MRFEGPALPIAVHTVARDLSRDHSYQQYIGKGDGSWSFLLMISIRIEIMIGCSCCDSQRSTASVFVTWVVLMSIVAKQS